MRIMSMCEDVKPDLVELASVFFGTDNKTPLSSRW